MQLENSHGGLAGKSIVNVIQDSLDKGMTDWNDKKEEIKKQNIWNECANSVLFDQSSQLQGYVAGIAKALGILRGTSVKTEINESRERISERSKSTVEIVVSAGAVSQLGT